MILDTSGTLWICHWEVSEKVNFLHADKHVSFLQIDTMTFDGDDQAFLKLPK